MTAPVKSLPVAAAAVEGQNNVKGSAGKRKRNVRSNDVQWDTI
jgi:hypothetical protein